MLATALAAGIALAACAGPSSPEVAKLGNDAKSGTTTSDAGNGGNRGTTTTTPPSTGDATRLLDEWTTCIRIHGDPNQADPTINATKDIEIHIPDTAQSLSNEVHTGTTPCKEYLNAAATALRNGQPPPQPPTEAQAVAFTNCMRANGVPDYPDPTAHTPDRTNFQGTGVTPTSPSVKKATLLCSKKFGQRYVSTGKAPPGVVQVTSGTHPGSPAGAPAVTGNGGSGSGG